jgi:hypothetical protein
MDSFGQGSLLILGFGWFVLLGLFSIDIFVFKNKKSLFIFTPITIMFFYAFYVILTGTSKPGCVTWHAVGDNAKLVGDSRYYGGRWRTNEHWEHDLNYIPEDCDCVTYHWFWGNQHNFTQDSVIKGQFKGPTVKPNKLIMEDKEDDDFFDDDEFFND